MQLAVPFLFPAGCDKVQLASQHRSALMRRSTVSKGQPRKIRACLDWQESQVAVISSCSCIIFAAEGKKGSAGQTETEPRNKAIKVFFVFLQNF